MSGLPHGIIVMGVSGSGKSTIGERLAQHYGWLYRDGDGFHPPENVAKMSAGTPLTDEDRVPWLAAIAAWLVENRQAGRHAIVSCSALKRAYRDVLVGGRPDEVRIVFLQGSRELIGARMARRKNHYMPTSLLDSQFATLEPPADDEHPITVSIEGDPSAIEAAIVAALEGR